MRGVRKEQRSLALPAEYWDEIDSLAHANRVRPAVYAASLLRGALETIRADNPGKSKRAQRDLFDVTTPRAGAETETETEKASVEASRRPKAGTEGAGSPKAADTETESHPGQETARA